MIIPTFVLAKVFSMTRKSDFFYKDVSSYYDQDADMDFEARAEVNPLLGKIRDDFRQTTLKYPFSSALEIGCGPGFDIEWFASRFPEREFTGIDISSNMISLAHKKITGKGLANAEVYQADERDLLNRFGPKHFDLVFVYFGALNTVASLPGTATVIRDLLKPGGYAVLTFVNKWYLREMLVQTLKMNFRLAFARLKKDWGGYSPERHLPSRCYSPREIRKAFRDFQLLEKKGYSIFYPAWYNYKKWVNNPEKTEAKWKLDHSLQNTFLWSKGEYTLFVFRNS